jgi:hypothetical protein
MSSSMNATTTTTTTNTANHSRMDNNNNNNNKNNNNNNGNAKLEAKQRRAERRRLEALSELAELGVVASMIIDDRRTRRAVQRTEISVQPNVSTHRVVDTRKCSGLNTRSNTRSMMTGQ